MYSRPGEGEGSLSLFGEERGSLSLFGEERGSPDALSDPSEGRGTPEAGQERAEVWNSFSPQTVS